MEEKPKFATGKLATGIISCVMFLFIGVQSCAAGFINSISQNGDMGGSAGLLCGMLITASGIVAIVTRNSFKKSGSVACIIMYTLTYMFSRVGSAVYKDLAIWGTIAFAFGVMHLLSLLHTGTAILIGVIASAFVYWVFFNAKPVNQNTNNSQELQYVYYYDVTQKRG